MFGEHHNFVILIMFAIIPTVHTCKISASISLLVLIQYYLGASLCRLAVICHHQFSDVDTILEEYLPKTLPIRNRYVLRCGERSNVSRR